MKDDYEQWREKFQPLFVGVAADVGREMSTAFGMAWNTRNLEAEAFLGMTSNYTMKFAEQVRGGTEFYLRDIIQASLREGWTIPQASKAIHGLFDQFVTGRERWWSEMMGDLEWFEKRLPPHRTEMIARTETIKASNYGSQSLYQSWGVEKKRWVAADDERTCPWCNEMHGRTIAVDGTFAAQGTGMTVYVPDAAGHPVPQRMTFDYEAVVNPPLHPNCRCTIVPWRDEWADLAGDQEPALPAAAAPSQPDVPWHAVMTFGMSDYDAASSTAETVGHLVAGLPQFVANPTKANHASRAHAKREIVSELVSRTGLDYEKVNAIIAQWAQSSNDTDMRSLSMQEFAAKEFGVPLSAWQLEQLSRVKKRYELEFGPTPWEDLAPSDQSAYANLGRILDEGDTRLLLRQMYENTQARLRQDGVPETVRLYRGVVLDDSEQDKFQAGQVRSIMQGAMSSWSTHPTEAQTFASDIGLGQFGVVLEADIPTSRFLSTSRTGYGCLIEAEVVVLGGDSDNARIRGRMIIDDRGFSQEEGQWDY